jgi:hypothetical protein
MTTKENEDTLKGHNVEFDNKNFKSDDTINLLADKYFESNTRVRNVLFVLITASIISFLSFWNSRPSSWVSNRYLVFQEARILSYKLDSLNNAKSQLAIITDSITYLRNDSSFLVKRSKLISKSQSLKTKINEISNYINSLDHQKLRDLKDFIEVKKLYNNKDWEEASNLFNSLVKESYIVKIGAFTSSFDINDLGIFAGLTLNILLLILWYCLERSIENLQIIKRLAKNYECNSFYYYYLGAAQVFTLPPKDSRKRSKIWIIMPYLLLLLPLITIVSIYQNDLSTVEFGFAINTFATLELICLSSIFSFGIVLFTYKSIETKIKIDREWEDWHSKVNNKLFSNDNSIEM